MTILWKLGCLNNNRKRPLLIRKHRKLDSLGTHGIITISSVFFTFSLSSFLRLGLLCFCWRCWGGFAVNKSFKFWSIAVREEAGVAKLSIENTLQTFFHRQILLGVNGRSASEKHASLLWFKAFIRTAKMHFLVHPSHPIPGLSSSNDHIMSSRCKNVLSSRRQNLNRHSFPKNTLFWPSVANVIKLFCLQFVNSLHIHQMFAYLCSINLLQFLSLVYQLLQSPSYFCKGCFDLFQWGEGGKLYRRGRISSVDLLVLTSLDQLLFILKLCISIFTKQPILMRRSTVLSILLQ